MPPPPPDHLLMPHRWEFVFMVLVGVPTAVAIVWALRAWRRDGDPLGIVMLAAGTACCLLEPLVDVLGLCWYPKGQAVEAFAMMGRAIPLFVVIGYAMTFGGFALLAAEVLRRRGPQSLWLVWLGGIVFTSLFEFFAIHTKSYVYYGQQPLRLFGWPTWWGPVNSLVAVAIGVLATRLRPRLRGWRVLALIPLATMVDAGVNGAAAWPVYTALWSHASFAATEVCGIVTWMLAGFGVWIVLTLAPAPAALPQRGRRRAERPPAVAG